MWRIHRDETCYSQEELIAWDIVLPQKHIPIIEQDKIEVKKLVPIIKALLDCPCCHCGKPKSLRGTKIFTEQINSIIAKATCAS